MTAIVTDGMGYLEAHKGEIRSAVRRHGGTGVVYVFGSVARAEDGPESDIDLLVEFGSDASLFDQASLELELTNLLGRAVDVMSLHAQGRAADHARATAIEL